MRNGDEEHYQEWIKPFDEPIGYGGDREMTNDNLALDFISLFLEFDYH